MANRFSINPLGGFRPGEGLRQALSGRDVRQEKMQLAAERQKIQDAMAGAAGGDTDAIDNLFALNPDLAVKYENRLFERQKREGMAADKAKTGAELDWAIKYKRAIDSGDETTASDLVTEAEANPLIDFDSTMMGKDVRQDQLVINTMLYKGLGKDAYKELIGGEAPVKGTFSITSTPTGFIKTNTATGAITILESKSKEAQIAKKQEKSDFDRKLKQSSTTFQRAKDIRNRFDKKSGEFVKVRDAFARVEVSAKDPSPAGDLSLIFNFMKMLDPGSTVREGEFATAAGAASVPERFKGAYKKVVSGEMLTLGQRKDFINKSKALMGKAKTQNKKDRAETLRLGKQWNVSESQLFGAQAPGAAAEFPGAPSIGTVEGGYEYLGGDPSSPDSWRVQ